MLNDIEIKYIPNKDPQYHRVKSKSEKDVMRQVTEFSDGTFICNCPLWEYRQTKECRHIRIIRNQRKNLYHEEEN